MRHIFIQTAYKHDRNKKTIVVLFLGQVNDVVLPFINVTDDIYHYNRRVPFRICRSCFQYNKIF